MSPLINLILVILGIVILIIIIKILINWNKSVKIKLKEEEKKYNKFHNAIKKLREEKPSQNNLELLNNLARNFFKERFNLGKDLSYLELSNEFKKKNQINSSDFCNIMSNLIYSDNKDDLKEIKRATNLLSSIIESNRNSINIH